MGSVRDPKPVYALIPLPGTLPTAPVLPSLRSQQCATLPKDTSQTTVGRGNAPTKPLPHDDRGVAISSSLSPVLSPEPVTQQVLSNGLLDE